MMNTVSQCRVHQCSKCPGDTEYYCKSCPRDLCSQCRENHMQDLKTIDHNVVIYSEKLQNDPTEYGLWGHSGRVCEEYRQLWKLTDISHSMEIGKLILVYIRNEKENGNRRKIYQIIRNDAFFYNPLLMQRIEADLKTCSTKIHDFQSEILAMAQRLKHQIDITLRDVDFKHRCLKQKIEIKKYIAFVHFNEQRYERSAKRPVRFLKKKFRIPQIKTSPHLTLHTSQRSMIESLNKKGVIDSLNEIQITEREKRRGDNEYLMTMMYPPKLYKYFTVSGVKECCHISVSSDQVWVSAEYKLILTNTMGNFVGYLDPQTSVLYGSHTFSSESELIYIDGEFNINKLSKDKKTTSKLIEKTSPQWEPRCVYWSPSTGDLLVGMHSRDTSTGRVIRYNQSGQSTQTFEHDSKKMELYKKPNYITENNNGDVVVSDYLRAVVVTERGGRHRFSYKGPHFWPRGICTDALSHILVCDHRKVIMLDKDGQFLTNLFGQDGIFIPYSLCYDANKHSLWVGSWDSNKVWVYRYLYHGRTV